MTDVLVEPEIMTDGEALNRSVLSATPKNLRDVIPGGGSNVTEVMTKKSSERMDKERKFVVVQHGPASVHQNNW